MLQDIFGSLWVLVKLKGKAFGCCCEFDSFVLLDFGGHWDGNREASPTATGTPSSEGEENFWKSGVRESMRGCICIKTLLRPVGSLGFMIYIIYILFFYENFSTIPPNHPASV